MPSQFPTLTSKLYAGQAGQARQGTVRLLSQSSKLTFGLTILGVRSCLSWGVTGNADGTQ